jgi:hypothetical protein
MVRRRSSARKKRTLFRGALGKAPAKRGGAWVVLVLAALVVVNLYVFVWDKQTGVAAVKRQAETPMAMPSAPLEQAPPVQTSERNSLGRPAEPAAQRSTVIDGKVGKSDTLGRVLKKSGLTFAEADEVIRALTGVLDFRTIRAGQVYHLERGGDGRVTSFDLALSKTHRVRAERATSGELVGSSVE